MKACSFAKEKAVFIIRRNSKAKMHLRERFCLAESIREDISLTKNGKEIWKTIILSNQLITLFGFSSTLESTGEKLCTQMM
jgi:hypothetical protein